MPRNFYKKCLNDFYLLLKNPSQSFSNLVLITIAMQGLQSICLNWLTALACLIFLIGSLSNAPFETKKSILMAHSIDSNDLLSYNYKYGKVNFYRTAYIIHCST